MSFVPSSMSTLRPGRSVAGSFFAVAVILLLAGRAHAQTARTWNVTSGTWTNTTSWAGGVVPLWNESAVFSGPAVGANSSQAFLSGTTAIAGLSFNGTGTTSLRSSSPTIRTLVLGTGGIRTGTAAGPVTIGSGAADDITTILAGSQTWTTLGGTRLTIAGGLRGSAATGQSQTLTFDGAGQTTVAGPITDGTSGGVLNLAKTGWGSLRLSASNSYSGTTTVTTGQLIASSNGALGSGPVIVTSPAGTVRSPTGGQLVLDGVQSGVTLSSNLTLRGAGPAGYLESTVLAYGPGVLLNVGNNTLSGVITSGTDSTWTNLSSTFGTVAMTGTLNLVTPRTTLGTTNGVGAGGFNIAGTLAGSQTLLKDGPGTLFLNPVETGSFSGVITTRGNTISNFGQNSIRITQNKVVGSNAGSGDNAPISLNVGGLEVRMDVPKMELSGTAAAGTNASVRTQGASMFLDHGIGSTATSGTLALSSLLTAGNPSSISGRNGYAVTGATIGGVGSADLNFDNDLGGGITITGTFLGDTTPGIK